jgi:hypothetical protein
MSPVMASKMIADLGGLHLSPLRVRKANLRRFQTRFDGVVQGLLGRRIIDEADMTSAEVGKRGTAVKPLGSSGSERNNALRGSPNTSPVAAGRPP